MAASILEGVLSGELSVATVCACIKNKQLIQLADIQVSSREFVLHFLLFVREKLTPVNQAHIVSPQKLKKPPEFTNVNGKKTSRVSLNYGSSSPMKSAKESSSTNIEGVSPIKEYCPSPRKTPGSPFNNRKKNNGFNGRQKESKVNGKNKSLENSFQISSLVDFPAMNSAPVAKKPGKKKNPRRITTTQVSQSNLSFGTNLEQASSFESSFENVAMDKLFLDDKRFKISTNVAVIHSEPLPITKEEKKTITERDVVNSAIIDIVVNLYTFCCLNNLVINFTLEIYFLFAVLTAKYSNDTVSFPFENLAGCVYFAVNCLCKLKNLLVFLDLKTIQLLSENARIHTFANIEFLASLQDSIDIDRTVAVDYQSFFNISATTGVPFQVDLDNRKTFPSDRHFVCFSKQRDFFYALVRTWQEKHLMQDFNIKRLLAKSVHDIMNPEVNTHYQFAKLFVAQLLEMCWNTLGTKAIERDTSDTVLFELKERYPEKFKSLQNRLTKPSVGHNPCPAPTFSPAEQFFVEFIKTANNFTFTKYLMHILYEHITTLNSNSFGVESQENNTTDDNMWQHVQVSIAELRVLAKFLGFIVSMPYKDSTALTSRDVIAEDFEYEKVLTTAYSQHSLLLTVPWLVDFFSMLDADAFKLIKYQAPMRCMHAIYCRIQLDCDIALKFSNVVILLHMGWLFEQPNITIDHSSSIELPPLQDTDGIDNLINTDKQFLYVICPFLNDLKKPLIDFAKGNNSNIKGTVRKITTLHTSADTSSNMTENLKNQLVDSFIRYLPKNIKDCMTFLTERHFANVKQHFSQNIFTNDCELVINSMKESFRTEGDSLDDIKKNNRELFNSSFEKGKSDLADKCNNYLKMYIDERVDASVYSLFPESSQPKLKTVASKVVKRNVRNKVQEWLNTNNELYRSCIDTSYTKFVKNAFKRNSLDLSKEIS